MAATSMEQAEVAELAVAGPLLLAHYLIFVKASILKEMEGGLAELAATILVLELEAKAKVLH